ncbi:hypothetical protein SLE2022_005490 [Rubroshorea leprosula]
MEFVGKTVKKDFKGFGVFTGVVKSYDNSSGFFEIVYADGDSEELDLSEVASLVMAGTNGEGRVEPKQVQEKPRVGRKPKKRRRVDRRAAQNEIGASLHPGKMEKETLDYMNGNSNTSVDLNEALVVNSTETKSADRNLNDTIEKEAGGEENSKLNGSVEMKNCIDLNSGFDFNLNEDFGSPGGVDNNGEGNLKRESIDLNLDADCFTEVTVNVDYSVEETRQKECGFDLNLRVEDEATKDGDNINYDGQAREFIHSQMVREKGKVVGTVNGESLCNGELKEVHVSGDWLLRSVGDIGKDSGVLIKEFNCHGVVLKDGLEEPGTAVVDDGCLGDVSNSYRQVRGRRKRRKVSENIDSTAEKVLRRSARRGSAKNQVLRPKVSFMDELSASPAVSAVTEEKPVKSGYKTLEEHIVCPPKLQLPPSSQSLNLDGVAVLDVFSIYACLRSFSTLLFLSPFELEDFVAALNSKSPSSLFDSINVSILQTLRKHLEQLANEGSESASECLRSLNWGLLDAITWPIFMVAYLLIHREGLNPGFYLSSLNPFRTDYYKQPASVKIEVLRCLCDDMIEVETIRSEVNRRSSASDSEMDFDRGVNIEVCKKRKAVVDLSGGSCSTEEGVDDTADWNFDECCLCKMDGSLICCDGCPAAYHSKCVGVASVLLPEGDWYCPECAIDRNKPWMKTFKSLRGAELLGIDPHGRLFFSSCGYLLVLDSSDNEFLFNYYHKDDLNAIIDVLKTSDIIYGDIIKAIYKQWHISAGSKGASGNFNLLSYVSLDRLVNGQIPAVSIQIPPLASSNICAMKNETTGGGKPEEKFVNLLDTVNKTEIPCVDSEGSDETARMDSHGNQGSVNLLAPGDPLPVRNPITGDTSKMQRGSGYMNSYAFAQTASSVLEELMPKSSDKKNGEALKSEEEIISTQMKTILKKSNMFQWPDVQHQNTDVQKEKCGWCFTCRYPTDDMDCLFNMIRGPLQKGSKSVLVGLQLKLKRKGHLIDVVSHIISIENRLHGLLLGPWLNPQYTKAWRESILKATDAASVKHLLLMLEANLHRRALSADWLKPLDSAVALGSASHAVATIRTSSKHGIARKRCRPSEFDVNPTSSAASTSICWWRGGQLSRQLFSWKILPYSLVSKAARQAGRVKIPGILYPENSDFAKRNKYVAWQAAVASSTSVEQVALQVRELDSNIRWDDIENTHPLPALDKEFKKSIRLFKKCVIRRKSLEGEEVKYLLDFGKRRSIPEIVMKNGTMVEESSSERKKYWLSESYVPLHLLRSFEEKRIARKSGKINPEISSKTSKAVKKPSKTRGFSYLFARAERPDCHQCGHCNKDVPIREGVCCQYCKGFFHKRHVRRSFGAIPAKCTYTCHRCQSGKWNIVAKSGKSDTKRKKTKADAKAIKSDTKRGKTNTKGVKQQSLKYKKSLRANKSVWLKDNKMALPVRRSPRVKNDKKVVAVVPLRRSSRKVKSISVQSKKRGRPKKVKQNSKKKTTKKSKKGMLQRKRTNACHSYWLNGLLLSRKDNDARVVQFKEASFFAPSEDLTVIDQPKCLLCCESGYTSRSEYIACQLCGGWYHGAAYGLDDEKKDKLIGFRCHICRERTPPSCPHNLAMRSEESPLVETEESPLVETEESPLVETQLNDEIQCPEKVTDSLQGSLAADHCLHKEHSGISLDTNQGPLMECELEAEDGK